MSEELNLTDVLYRQRSKPRGDEHEAHIADLYGCDRATWFRRNGHKPTPFTPDRQARFAIGHGYEREVIDTLRGAGKKVIAKNRVEYLGLTGHPDATIEAHDLVLDTKTTDQRKPDETVKQHYAIQVSAYALAQERKRAAVLVKYASHAEKQYAVNPEEWRDRIAERAAEIHTRTAPGSPMPPPIGYPREVTWACPEYCDFTQCEKHKDHEEPLP